MLAQLGDAPTNIRLAIKGVYLPHVSGIQIQDYLSTRRLPISELQAMTPSAKKEKLDEIRQKFEETAFGLTQERSDFLLPQIIDFVTKKKWINLRPEYQRRLVWDVKKRSAFIESLLLNIPIPTLFLFERELGRYEVMDGQQRINAVEDFYAGKYALKGLEKWKELNGFKHSDLPEVLRRGLDRRRLSATVVVLDSTKPRPTPEAGDNDVRKMVFERLNTGGQHLNPQELRNCLYAGPFNDLLIRLASKPRFKAIWGITPRKQHATHPVESSDDSEADIGGLNENKLYSRMIDCEIVLRFFAFSTQKKLHGSVRSILDDCMERNLKLTEREVSQLEAKFNSRLKLAQDIFHEETFCYQDENGKPKLSRPLYDAVMVALDSLWDKRQKLLTRHTAVVANVARLLRRKKAFAVIVGRPNTADAIQQRINLLKKAMSKACR